MSKTYLGIVALEPKNSKFLTSACTSWIRASKLYKVDLSISCFLIESALVGIFSSFSGILSILYAALSQHLCYTDMALLHQMLFNISPSLALSAIFCTLSVNKLCTSLLKLCCDLYIIKI